MFFGFSLTKLLVLAAIIAIVWYGFKWFARIGQVRADERTAKRDRVREGKKNRGRGRRPAPGDDADVETMIKCPTCGAYVSAREPSDCGRADCPYP